MSERELRKIECTLCGGTGTRAYSKTRKCPTCSGKGWTKGEWSEEEICRECNGDGSVTSEQPSKCRKCAGAGYVVQIVEIVITAKHECPDCEGERGCWIKVTCFECQGAVYAHVDSTGHYRNVNGCPRCNSTGELDIFEDCETCGGSGSIESKEERIVTPARTNQRSAQDSDNPE